MSRIDRWKAWCPLLLVGALFLACAGGPRAVHRGADPRGEGARAALAEFVRAAQAQDFDVAWRLLASPLRERYTPARLKEDFLATRPLAEEKVERARLALSSVPRLEGLHAEFPISETTAVRLVEERDGWRVAALE